jgi:hypothetical protein
MSHANRRLPQYLEQNAYRYGGIALAIVMLVERYNSAFSDE